MTPQEVRELVATLEDPKPCLMELKRRASNLFCMREELAHAPARDIAQLLGVRGEILKSSDTDFCGLDETVEMVTRQQSESIIYTALFEDIDDVFSVYVTGKESTEINCIRVKRQTTTQRHLRNLIGRTLSSVNRDGLTVVLYIGDTEVDIEQEKLQVYPINVNITDMVGQIITNVRAYPFGVSLSFGMELTLAFEKGKLQCRDHAWRIPDPAMYGEHVESF